MQLGVQMHEYMYGIKFYVCVHDSPPTYLTHPAQKVELHPLCSM